MRMRMLAGWPAVLGALALVSCAAGPPPASSASPPAASPTSPTSIADTITVRGTQGLIIAELAYNTAGNAVLTATRVGLVRPGTPLAARLRDLNSTASRALEVARSTRSSVEQAAAVAKAMTAIVSLRQATPAVAEK